MKMPELASRSWYYFRIGYYTYLSFLLGYGSTMVTIYYLAIKNIPELERVFSRFWLFAVLATAVGVPMGVVTGWVHTKRSSLWKAEIDIGAEANPYYYKLPPGYWREALAGILRDTTAGQKAFGKGEPSQPGRQDKDRGARSEA